MTHDPHSKAGSQTIESDCVERRRHPRLPLPIPMFVRGADANGREFMEFATAANISAGGALVLVPRRANRPAMAVGLKVQLEVPKAPLPPAYTADAPTGRFDGTVVRVDHGQTYHTIGVMFAKTLAT